MEGRKPVAYTRYTERSRDREWERIWFGNWCCLQCSSPSHCRFDKYVYILLQCAMPIEWFVTASCYVLVSFHHQNWCFISIFCCHLCRCESYFVWHEWDIFCLIKFKLCSASVRFGLVWFGSDVWRVHGYTVLCVWCNFNADGFSWFVVVVVISLSLSLDFNAVGFCLCSVFHCTCELVFGECTAVVAASDAKRTCDANANTQDRYKLYRENHKRNILPCCLPLALVLHCWADGREKERWNDLSHYYSLSNLIELLWYITFRFA